MRIVFMGTPELSAVVLERLSKDHEVVAVYTRPDAVRRRGNKLSPSPVKEIALRLSIPVFTPKTLRNEAVVSELKALEPDVICVAAYGCLLPADVLSIPRFDCLNVHTSLLPRWRGAAPIERAILAGDEVTGVCIMRMEEGLDTGDYCKRVEIPMDEKGIDDLTMELANAGAQALVEALADIEHGTVTWVKQSAEGVLYASKIEKGELHITADDDVETILRKVRTSNSAHPAKTIIAGRGVILEEASRQIADEVVKQVPDHEVGDVFFTRKQLIMVVRGGAVRVIRLRPDGKKSMDAVSFASGLQNKKQLQCRWGIE